MSKSKSKRSEEYRGVMEGDPAHAEAAVKAGEDRKGSTRGTERRLEGLTGRGTGKGEGPGVEMGERGTGEAKLRRRLAEVLSSAGVDSGRVALEVLYLLPPEFVRGYTDLFHRALATGEDGMGLKNDRKAELGRARARGGAKQARGNTRGVWAVRDARALGEKERVDRRLRKMAREMRDGANAGTGKEQVARCGEELPDGVGCGKWIETSWKYCPFCGHRRGEALPMEG